MTVRIHVINGRFQPFHLGHLDYAREAAAACDLLVLGLTRPPLPISEIDLFDSAQIAPHRLDVENNPLVFAERAYVAQAAIGGDQAITCPVVVAPFPIDTPKLLPSYIPRGWTVFTTDHEPWNQWKQETLRNLGYRVEIVCVGRAKAINGSDIRSLIAAGDSSWRELVSPSAARALDDLNIPARLRRP